MIDSDLEVALWREIDSPVSLVILLTSFDKVPFHQIQEIIVLLLINSGIFDN
jgi:hypothetical protein